MINTLYKLTTPLSIETFCQNLDFDTDQILVRPEMLSICKADIRYYFGMRDARVLRQRLPLALVHEACGTVLHDKKGRLRAGDKVILLPNIPGEDTRYEENYRLDSRFRSSRADGFMQEMVALPYSQVIPYGNIADECASVTEFISVGVHAVRTYLKKVKHQPRRVAVWGDGALGYVVCSLLRHYLPRTHITVIGVNVTKLSMFQFADERRTIDELDAGTWYDDVFECVGGQASGSAIAQMIDTIMPEGIMTLMGVSEEPVPVNTRMVLEKGLTLIGRSRSAREDFEQAVEILQSNAKFAGRMAALISEVVPVKNVNDIHKAFNESKIVDFKLVMEWQL